LAFGLNRGKARRLFAKCQEKLARGWSPADETRRILKLLNTAPALPARYSGNETYQRMYAHAITGLNSLFIRGEGWLAGKKRLPWTTKDLLAIPFFWDTSFSCVGASEFNPEACREALEAFTDNTSPRGGLPGTLCDTHRAGEGQAPVMAWAAWTVYRREKQAGWLARVYPALGEYYHFWMKYHSSHRSLPLYYNAGQAGDNDVRWDPVYGRKMGNEPLSGVEPPDLSGFFVTELRCLAKMASELGLEGESTRWQQEADSLAQKVVDSFFFSEEAMFYDVREGTHQKFSGAKGPFLFIPLRAQVPLPAEDVKKVIEEHMLNPQEFFGELPFPSVSYDDPQYDPNGYWRGRIWPHVVYWMIQTLWVNGYHAEAEETAARMLKMFQRTPWIHENYNSGSGDGWDTSEKIGFPDYNWSFSTLILILLERYKDPLF
jgi:putative isomerase